MTNEPRCLVTPSGIIGVTDDGYPIVTGEYACLHWRAGAKGLCAMQECWYCRFADFRKSVDMTLGKSVCRCPQNRVEVTLGGKNEEVLSENK